MGKILPTRQQFKQLMEMDYEGPIFMINLLKFKPDGGAESYARYVKSGSKVFQEIGIEVVFREKISMPVIGDEEWDEILIAKYPSIDAFIEMNRNKEYQKSVQFRTEALIDSRLYLVKAEEG